MTWQWYHEPRRAEPAAARSPSIVCGAYRLRRHTQRNGCDLLRIMALTAHTLRDAVPLLGYALCSSSLLVLNKLVLRKARATRERDAQIAELSAATMNSSAAALDAEASTEAIKRFAAKTVAAAADEAGAPGAASGAAAADDGSTEVSRSSLRRGRRG